MGKFSFKFWWNSLSVWDTPIYLFLDDNLSKCQGILTQLGTCIDIKEIWFGIAKEQIYLSFFDRIICLWNNNGGALSFKVFIFL